MSKKTIARSLAIFALAFTAAAQAWSWNFFPSSSQRDRGGPPPPPPPGAHYQPRPGDPPRNRPGQPPPRPGKQFDRQYGKIPPGASAVPPLAAPKGYLHSGTFIASGGVECPNRASKPIKTVRVVCENGNVTINTMVVREGAKKTEIRVLSRLAPGGFRDIPLPTPCAATGLRFGTSGGGTFSVFVH